MTPELEAALQKIDGATRSVILDAVPPGADVRRGVGEGTLAVPAAADVRSGVPVDATVGTLVAGGDVDLPQVWLDGNYEAMQAVGLDAYGTAQEAYNAAAAKATVTPTRLIVGDKDALKAFNAIHFRGNWNHAMSVLTGSTSALRFAADQPFTIEYWILGTGYCGSPTYENNWYTGPRLWWTSTDFSITCAGGGRCGSARAFEGGVFHHVAFQWDGSAWSLWVDGVSEELATSWTVPYTPTGGAGRFGMFEGFQSGSDLGPMRISDTVRYAEEFTPPFQFTNDSHTKFATHFAEGTLVRNSIIHDISSNGLDLTFGCDADAWGDLCYGMWFDRLKISAGSWDADVSLESAGGSSAYLESITLSGSGLLKLNVTDVTIGSVNTHSDAKLLMTDATITALNLQGGFGENSGNLDATLVASTLGANLRGSDGTAGGNGEYGMGGAPGSSGESGADGGAPTPGSDGEDGADGIAESPNGETGGAGGDGSGSDGSSGSDGATGSQGNDGGNGENGGDGGNGGSANIVLLEGSTCSLNVSGGNGGLGGYAGGSEGGCGGNGGSGGNGVSGIGGDGGAGGDAYPGGAGVGGVGENGGNATGGGGGAGGNGGNGGPGGAIGFSADGGAGGSAGAVVAYVSSTSSFSVSLDQGWGGEGGCLSYSYQGGGGTGGIGGVADNTSNVGVGGQGGLNADGETRAGSGSDGTFTEASEGSSGSDGVGWSDYSENSGGNYGSEGVPSEPTVVTLDVP